MAQLTNILTKEDLQNYAPDLDLTKYGDTTISGMIASATKQLASFCNVKGFDYRLETDKAKTKISNSGDLMVWVSRPPVSEVLSMNVFRGGFSADLTIDDGNGNSYLTIEDPGYRITLPGYYMTMTGTYLAGGGAQLVSLRGSGLWTNVQYYGGYQEIPADLKQAVVLQMRDTISEVPQAGVDRFDQGTYSETRSASKGGQSKIAQQAADILNRGGYVRPVLF